MTDAEVSLTAEALGLSLADRERAVMLFAERACVPLVGAVWAALAELLRKAGEVDEGALFAGAEGDRVAWSTMLEALQFATGDVVTAVEALPARSRPFLAHAFLTAEVAELHDLFATVAAVAVSVGW